MISKKVREVGEKLTFMRAGSLLTWEIGTDSIRIVIAAYIEIVAVVGILE